MDPLFQKTTEMFSDGGVLSSYIFCRDDSHELLLDSASHQGNGEFDPKLALSSQTGLNDFKCNA